MLGETVEAKPNAAGDGCQYLDGVDPRLIPVITVMEDSAETGGIEAEQAEAETELSGMADPLTVNGNAGFMVINTLLTVSVSRAAVAADGLIVAVTVNGGDPAENVDVNIQLIELTLAAL